MFRIAPQNPMPTPEPDQDEAVSNPAVMSDQDGDEAQDSPTTTDQDDLGLPKLDPANAVYMGAEYGPFKCANCIYFEGKGACHLVSGDIEPDGCCNLFTSKSNGSEEESPEEDAQEPVEETPDEDASNEGGNGSAPQNPVG